MKGSSAAHSGGTVRDSHPIVLFSQSGAAQRPAQATERMVFMIFGFLPADRGEKMIDPYYAERSSAARMAAEAASGV